MKDQKASKFDFKGVITALITPFKNGKVDYRSLQRLVEHQIKNGIQGFVINGTTAESPTLSELEVQKIFRFIKKITGERIPLILGAGTNSTASTIVKTKMAAALRAEAALIVTPYYNKPPQRGLVAHFETVARAAAKTKIILYNVPGRTAVNMTAETMIELSRVKNIVGVKEASGQVGVVPALRAQANKNFIITSGDDLTCIDFMLAGGDGVISVLSHVIPAELTRLASQALKGDESAHLEFERYKELTQLLFIESNPIPVKMALYLMGIIDSPELRLPLIALSSHHKIKLKNELKRLNVL